MGYVFQGCKVTYSPSCDLGIVMNVTMDDKNIPVWYHGIFSDSKDNEKLLAIYSTARLIAAAPELLEVIREAVDSAEREMAKGRKASPGLAAWLEKARAALAKVRGEKSE